MSTQVPLTTTRHVRDTCLCLHLQRAARAIGRHFDKALRPAGLNNGQFSLLMALNQPEPPSIGSVARLLGMDRTTVTAVLKPLTQRGLIEVLRDAQDQRTRRLRLSLAGQEVLAAALPIWQETHQALERGLPASPDALREALRQLTPP